MQLTVRVSGRVQGVGFRDFVVQHARRLGLSGHVKNMADGTLYVVASGPSSSLESLLAAIERGPVAARVERVETGWTESENASLAQHFEVLY